MKSTFFKALAALAVASFSSVVSAHCDTLDGPVVSAAKKSIETKNPNHFLIWVREKEAADVVSQFQKVLADREASPERADEIDRAFFESLVRVHREWEGAPYAGLKAAAEDEIVILADAAIASGSGDSLRTEVLASVGKRFDGRFAEIVSKKDFPTDDVRAWREYVETYVSFLHWMEALSSELESAHASEKHGAETAGHAEEGAETRSAAHGGSSDAHSAQTGESPVRHEEPLEDRLLFGLLGTLLGIGWTVAGTGAIRKSRRP